MFEKRKVVRKKNPTKAEDRAIKELSGNRNVIFKSAEKRGSAVIWSREKYEQEAFCQLNNSHYYSLPTLCDK